MKHFLLLGLLVFVSVYAEEDLVRYDGYVVFRLIPTTTDQLEALRTLEDSDSTVRNKIENITNGYYIFIIF